MSSLGDKAQGMAEGLKGNVKEAVGKMTKNLDLEAEGRIDRAKGAAHEKVSEVKDMGPRGERIKDTGSRVERIKDTGPRGERIKDTGPRVAEPIRGTVHDDHTS